MKYSYVHPTNPMKDDWVDEDFDPGDEGGTIYFGEGKIKTFESRALKFWQKDRS